MVDGYSSKKFLDEIILKTYNSYIINYEKEVWNEKYESFNFQFDGIKFKSRLAKKTPKKAGYFFAIWCKDDTYNNRPFNTKEFEDKLIVNILDKSKKGIFVFPKNLLADKRIISTEESRGKMAMRVYPSWENKLNKTAYKTQQWQIEYFIDFSSGFDEDRVKELYSLQ